MKLVFLTLLTAITMVIAFAVLFIPNKLFIKNTQINEICRAQVMAGYESAWDNCCYKSGQGSSCKAKLSCEPKWNTYVSEMKSCSNEIQ